ncbi:LPS O-antigen chain length determinant protein WzzB [Pseudomonas sp. JZ134]|uniref:LPS O-antigen chain length determinant protein WzzB n=1 Tax=Pseudomonas sp. JZ134 TaxID=2806615 RepID=UPI003D9FC4BC
MNATAQSLRNDEIDLLMLAEALWRRKGLIVLVALICTFAAVVYAFLAKPSYEAKLHTLPPSLNKIAGFNYGRISELGLQPFDASFIYSVFTRNLVAESTRNEFFLSTYLPSLSDVERQGSRDAQYALFSERLAIHAPAKNTPDRFTVHVQGTDPEQAATWAKEYTELAKQKALHEMLENAMSEARVRARGLEQQIETLRASAKDRREDRIVRLGEALRIAKQINLADPPVITGGSAGSEREVSAFMDGALMYMRGSKALEAEIANLTQRTSDDPFIPGLRDLQEKHSLYSHIRINPESVAVMRQDGPAEIPDSPIAPKRSLVILLGLAVGIMLGVLIALFRIVMVGCRRR